MNAINQLNALYSKREYEGERFGQFFVNRFIDHPWPELFYQEDREKAQALIEQWLVDNQYQGCLPRYSKGWEKNMEGLNER